MALGRRSSSRRRRRPWRNWPTFRSWTVRARRRKRCRGSDPEPTDAMSPSSTSSCSRVPGWGDESVRTPTATRRAYKLLHALHACPLQGARRRGSVRQVHEVDELMLWFHERQSCWARRPRRCCNRANKGPTDGRPSFHLRSRL